jgi:hypothetical protein
MIRYLFLHGGPYDGQKVGSGAPAFATPTELRFAARFGEDDHQHLYQLRGTEGTGYRYDYSGLLAVPPLTEAACYHCGAAYLTEAAAPTTEAPGE